MDLALNNLQRLICHKTQQTNQLIEFFYHEQPNIGNIMLSIVRRNIQ